jgi:hypothetical protein
MSNDLHLIRKRSSGTLRLKNLLQLSQEETEGWLGSIAPAKSESSWRMLGRWHSFLYAVTRALVPATVVETGVLYGHSSAAILAALEDNMSGRLVSIDLPPEQHKSIIVGRRHVQVGIASNQLTIGCAVPFLLRSRWSLRLGDSLALIPKILDELGPISIFIHDSLHTFEHMMAEFRLGYEGLKPGGILISDDIDYNSAWSDFCLSQRETGKVIRKESNTSNLFGYLVKPAPFVVTNQRES